MFDVSRNPLAVVILAGGTGGRMNSKRPKPLHKLAGASLLQHALRTAKALLPQRRVVVVGADAPDVAAMARRLDPEAQIAVQPRSCGTGNAALCALPALTGFQGRVLVLYADTPLTRPETLKKLVGAPGVVAALGFETPCPFRYGRLILNDSGGLERIVESGDATEAEAAVTLCNSGVMAFDAEGARRWLPALTDDNCRNEYFLTDVVALARSEGGACAVVVCDADEALGVNSRAELAAAEAAFQRRARYQAMENGVTMAAPETVYFSYDTRLGRDVTIGPHVVFAPGVTVRDEVEITAFACLADCVIQRGTRIKPFAGLQGDAGNLPGWPGIDQGEIRNPIHRPGAHRSS
ncbi:NTP transferase domain-containing protein [Puniceibacterium confluentis]|uniref:NTP transferase domain-containing protein n=1 Tax=Puniceibacterium confluentis TaxID=1958944 RepID=UPI0011B73890|nr:NTP transferase domain-containing protein [Puniceibacterium confluentis]